MGYFDSPKNMALWERELESLDAERERRRAEGFKPAPKRAAQKRQANSMEKKGVRRITLAMLEEIEKEARRAERSRASEKQPVRQEEHSRTRMAENPRAVQTELKSPVMQQR